VAEIGIIGGTGIYDPNLVKNPEEIKVHTPYGSPSDIITVGFIPVRKPGKLPAKTMRINYQKEYGIDGVEIHEDGIKKGQRVLIVDDVVATGGTIKAVAELVKKLGGEVVGLCFLVELSYLNPRENLKGYDVFSLIKYEKEDEV
jgi:adenine phosphoribosyltransferase